MTFAKSIENLETLFGRFLKVSPFYHSIMRTFYYVIQFIHDIFKIYAAFSVSLV